MSVGAVVEEFSPSVSVIESVAAREGVDPMELEVPLLEVIDPDALDALVRTGNDERNRPPIQVSFTYHGYNVIVTSDGLVHVSMGNSTS
jgi:hypothetical protein